MEGPQYIKRSSHAPDINSFTEGKVYPCYQEWKVRTDNGTPWPILKRGQANWIECDVDGSPPAPVEPENSYPKSIVWTGTTGIRYTRGRTYSITPDGWIMSDNDCKYSYDDLDPYQYETCTEYHLVPEYKVDPASADDDYSGLIVITPKSEFSHTTLENGDILRYPSYLPSHELSTQNPLKPKEKTMLEIKNIITIDGTNSDDITGDRLVDLITVERSAITELEILADGIKETLDGGCPIAITNKIDSHKRNIIDLVAIMDAREDK